MSQPNPSWSGPKQLRRSRTDRYLGGVCGGLAKYLNMDPTLVRILTVVITLFTAVPAIVYLVALFVVPEEDVTPAVPTGQPGDAVWGAGGPPWAPNAQAQPSQPTQPPTTFSGAMRSPQPGEPTDPPRREDSPL